MGSRKSASFVKAARTDTPVATSRSHLDKMLRRYGASQISMSEDFETRHIILTFVVPDSTAKGAARVPVKLPVSIYAVYHALFGRPSRASGESYLNGKIEQAERVAWRNLVLWVDAALSAATIGLQTITEAFFAHAVVGAGGERMVELVEAAQGQLGPGVQRLLTAPAETDGVS